MYELKILPIACCDLQYYVSKAILRQALAEDHGVFGKKVTFSGEAELDISDFPAEARQYLRSARVVLDPDHNSVLLDIAVVLETKEFRLRCRHCGTRVEWRDSCNWVYCPSCGRYADTPTAALSGWTKGIMGSDPVFYRALPAWVEVA